VPVRGPGPQQRVITLDLRGHGRSSKPGFGYRIARFSRDVYELIDYLGLEHADVLGWSIGVSAWSTDAVSAPRFHR